MANELVAKTFCVQAREAGPGIWVAEAGDCGEAASTARDREQVICSSRDQAERVVRFVLWTLDHLRDQNQTHPSTPLSSSQEVPTGRDVFQTPGVKLVSRRVFTEEVQEVGTFSVEELILEWGHPLLRKILWCHQPVEQLVVNGRPNPLHHKNYCADTPSEFKDPQYPLFRAAQRRVQESFHKEQLVRQIEARLDELHRKEGRVE